MTKEEFKQLHRGQIVRYTHLPWMDMVLVVAKVSPDEDCIRLTIVLDVLGGPLGAGTGTDWGHIFTNDGLCRNLELV